MINNKIHYFRILDCRKTTYKISQLINNNLVVKNKILDTYKLPNNTTLNNLKDIEENMIKKHCISMEKLTILSKNLDEKWNNYRKEYLELLEDSLGIILDDSEKYTISCYLSPMPFNMIDFSENTIYLNADFSENELFKKFVIMLTKIIVLDWWKKHNNWGWNYNYRAENKIWLFIEIAIDAIFSNTKLHKISNNPSYKFFYNAKINDVYFMDKFRELYNKISLNDFLDSVFMFVIKNYSVLVKFKDYLY